MITDIELDEEMEMPTPCQHCGKWFDLNDGHGSEKWHKGIVICPTCGREEEKEIERDEEIQDLKNELSDAEYTVKSVRKQLVDYGLKEYKQPELSSLQVFSIDEVRELINQWNDNQFTIGKLTEILNEKATGMDASQFYKLELIIEDLPTSEEKKEAQEALKSLPRVPKHLQEALDRLPTRTKETV